jgi:transglutaminase-like putative cysteine protease
MNNSRIALMLGAATLGLFLRLSLPGTSIAQQQPQPLDAGQDYSGKRSEPVQYQVDFSAVVTAPYHTKVLRVWLPLPPSNSAQEVRDNQLSTFPVTIDPQINTEPVYGNRFAYFEFRSPKGAQIIRHRFQAKVWQMDWDVDPGRIVAVDHWPESFVPYLRDVDGLAGDDAFQGVLQNLLAVGRSPTASLFASIQWIDSNMKYDHVQASLQASAERAFQQRRGHCSDYHGLCATFGRSLGVPTRVVYGLNMFPKESPSHCKMEAFLPPYGWVSFDLSETQKLIALIEKAPTLTDEEKVVYAAAARNRLQRGFRDNTWLGVTRGVDYALVPPASKSVRVVRTIYAEADGVPLPEPDPANPNQRTFAWMTAHDFQADRRVAYPYKDYTSLDK